MAEKNQVQSGGEAEVKTPEKKAPKTTAKSTSKSAPKSTAKKSSSKGGKTGREIWDENVIRDSETAKERGRNGGIKSGEVRRAKRDARETIQYMFSRMVVSEQIKNNLKELGFEPEEYTNMAALQGRLFAMAKSGNLEAYKLLMTLGGYEPEENRKERESLSADVRRAKELDAKIEALGKKGENASLALNLDDEDGNNDVVIYMPQIQSEEDCEVKDDKPTEDAPTDDTTAN